MTDVHTPEQRRRNMAAVRSRDTRPELIVRRLAHRMGYRFRLYRRDLPGKPDLVFPRLKKVVFVHGCFWHRHSCRAGTSTPKANAEFWEQKRKANAERDQRNVAMLAKLEWDALVVWECETRKPDEVQAKLQSFLRDGRHAVNGPYPVEATACTPEKKLLG